MALLSLVTIIPLDLARKGLLPTALSLSDDKIRGVEECRALDLAPASQALFVVNNGGII
jgi:hypothetical protein